MIWILLSPLNLPLDTMLKTDMGYPRFAKIPKKIHIQLFSLDHAIMIVVLGSQYWSNFHPSDSSESN